MKILPLIISLQLFFLNCAFSQGLLFRYNTGIASGEMYNMKENMIVLNAQLGGEIKITRGILLSVLAGFENVRFSYYDINDQIFNTRTNGTLTGKLTHSFFSTKAGGHFFYSLGCSADLAVKDRKEVFNSGTKNVISNNVHGYNLAFLADLGYKFILSKQFSFSVSLLTQNDFHEKYRLRTDEIKYERMLFSVGCYYTLKTK